MDYGTMLINEEDTTQETDSGTMKGSLISIVFVITLIIVVVVVVVVVVFHLYSLLSLFRSTFSLNWAPNSV
jgi:flagellar basal body-associated protein FliL